MPNTFFSFKQFTVHQDACAMKVCTDACLFGAWCADELDGSTRGKRLLDIGTGTGLLSLMVAQKTALCIDAVELDPKAAEQARQNVAASGFENIRVVQENIEAFQPEGYDYIISNPPFYESELSSPYEDRSAAHHKAGLNWNQLFQIIGKKLSADGSFFLLLPYKRLNEIDHYLHQNNLHLQQKIAVRHSPKHAPTRLLLKGSRRKSLVQEEDWAINESDSYSTAFKQLLKDYYLAL